MSTTSLDSRAASAAAVVPPPHADGPYASPVTVGTRRHAVDAVLVDALRITAGPYVPAPFRTRPHGADYAEFAGQGEPIVQPTAAPDLPWINAFLQDASVHVMATPMDTPATPEATREATPEATLEAMLHVDDDEDVSSNVTVNILTASAHVESGEHWAFDEASQEIRSLANEIRSPEAAESSSVSSSSAAEEVGASLDIDALESALQAPLPMWQDDDLLDIMPLKQTPAAENRDEHWAAQARRETRPANHAEEAATLLESVARRVRDGSLTISGYTPQMSDAAGLAATLAALLNSPE